MSCVAKWIVVKRNLKPEGWLTSSISILNNVNNIYFSQNLKYISVHCERWSTFPAKLSFSLFHESLISLADVLINLCLERISPLTSSSAHLAHSNWFWFSQRAHPGSPVWHQTYRRATALTWSFVFRLPGHMERAGTAQMSTKCWWREWEARRMGCGWRDVCLGCWSLVLLCCCF